MNALSIDSKSKFLSDCLPFPGSNYYVRILSTIDRELLKPSASVALHKHSNALVDVLPPEADSSITMLQAGQYRCQSHKV
jgi:ATP-dependent 26S proteasome regulatory subunit